MVFNATFNNISVYHDGQFYWWLKRRKSPTCRKSLTNDIVRVHKISSVYSLSRTDVIKVHYLSYTDANTNNTSTLPCSH